MRRKVTGVVAALVAATTLAGCTTDAGMARHNLDTAADQFEVQRRIVFINGITDEYMLEIEGRCSYQPEGNQVVVICKVADGNGADSFKKHSLVRSDNVTVVVEQLEGSDVSAYHHRVIFKPQSVVPDVDLQVDPNG